MGDSHTGGGGSVRWHYDVKNLKAQAVTHQPSGRHFLDGGDEGGEINLENFVISIALLDGQTLADFKNSVTTAFDYTDPSNPVTRAVFSIKIKDNPNQIQITWPDKQP